jgi:ubiquinone biosynthesis protein UbiJ
LLTHARPDIEEELSAVIGDTAAHGLGEFAEESRDVPSRYEVDQFSKRVNELRDDVDRLAARIGRLGGCPR